jgi:signal peptidase II
MTASYRLMLIVAAAVVALDATGKTLARAALPLSLDSHTHGPHLYGLAGFERVGNAGSALGFAQGGASWLPLAVVGLGVAFALPHLRRATPGTFAAAGLLAGGALGNLVDRIRFGAVTDFMQIGSARHGIVLNPADLALVAGVLLALTTSDARRRGGSHTSTTHTAAFDGPRGGEST